MARVHGDRTFVNDVQVDGDISVPTSGLADTESFGAGAAAGSTGCTSVGSDAKTGNAGADVNASAFGFNATADSNNCTAVGANSAAGASGGDDLCLALGASATASQTNSVAIAGVASANHAIAVGVSTDATHELSIVMGLGAQSTAVSRCTIGTIGGSFDAELQIGLGVAEFGATPPSSQPVAIADVPTGGSATAAANATAINAILAVLRARGTIAI